MIAAIENLSVILFAVMVFFPYPISNIMQASAEALDLTAQYVRICGAGIVLNVFFYRRLKKHSEVPELLPKN